MARVTPEPAGAPSLRVLCARMGILNTQSDNFMLPLQRSGNRKTRTDKRLGTTLTYAYDNIYQLLTAKQGTTTKESYTGACPERYSSREAMRVSRRNPVGNRLSSVGVSPYSYNSSNQPGAPSLRVLGARVGIHEYSVRYSILCYDKA